MDIIIHPGKLSGTVAAIPSKSQAHRLLICAAFSDKETTLYCPDTNRDIEATADCLRSLGAKILRTDTGYTVTPTKNLPKTAALDCGESGSTLRFMLPIVGALGVDGTFQMHGRLPQRPLSPLWEEMERMGCVLSRPDSNLIRCTGKLRSGSYTIDGSISSQFITGLLYAMALIPGECGLTITGKIESQPYIQMTQHAMESFGIDTANYKVKGSYPFSSPGNAVIEGDWSNAAFFLAAQAMGSQLKITGLNPESPQGDRVIVQRLSELEQYAVISAADIPDLVPIMAVTAAAKKGAVFTNVARLRLKESDRVETVASMLRNLGAEVSVTQDTLTVSPAQFHSCAIDASGDHRIAMAAAIAATATDGPITILGAECVAKSYPAFWQEYKKLGGNYEQHIR